MSKILGRKHATTIDEQISILEKRGMLLNDRAKSKEYLLDIGYYRLGLYWHFFEIDKFRNFASNTSIDDICKLYYFDFDLKYLLSKYIHRIEVHFRAQLIYITSNKYKDLPNWYIDTMAVSKDMVDAIIKLYNRNKGAFKRKNKPIQDHLLKYKEDEFAPAWKTIEFFTFGQIIKLYKSLIDESIKLEIASIYGYSDVNAFQNHISAIVNIRNICSHNGVLFNHNQPIGIRKIPNSEFRIRTRNQTNVQASIYLVLSVLNLISKNRKDDLKKQLNDLLTNILSNKEIAKILNEKFEFLKNE